MYIVSIRLKPSEHHVNQTLLEPIISRSQWPTVVCMMVTMNEELQSKAVSVPLPMEMARIAVSRIVKTHANVQVIWKHSWELG